MHISVSPFQTGTPENRPTNLPRRDARTLGTSCRRTFVRGRERVSFSRFLVPSCVSPDPDVGGRAPPDHAQATSRRTRARGGLFEHQCDGSAFEQFLLGRGPLLMTEMFTLIEQANELLFRGGQTSLSRLRPLNAVTISEYLHSALSLSIWARSAAWTDRDPPRPSIAADDRDDLDAVGDVSS